MHPLGFGMGIQSRLGNFREAIYGLSQNPNSDKHLHLGHLGYQQSQIDSLHSKEWALILSGLFYHQLPQTKYCLELLIMTTPGLQNQVLNPVSGA